MLINFLTTAAGAAATSGNSVKEICDNSDFSTLVNVINTVINLIRIGIPVILIIMGSVDLGKAVMQSKEEDIKKAQSLLIKKAIAAVVVFLLATIIKLILKLIGNAGDSESVLTCFSGMGF